MALGRDMGLSGMLLVFHCGLARFLNTQFSKRSLFTEASGLFWSGEGVIPRYQSKDVAETSSFFGRLEKTPIMSSELK